MNRRGFLFGAGAALAVVRTPGLLMPIRPFDVYDVMSELIWTHVEWVPATMLADAFPIVASGYFLHRRDLADLGFVEQELVRQSRRRAAEARGRE